MNKACLALNVCPYLRQVESKTKEINTEKHLQSLADRETVRLRLLHL